jgi:hypothetical protein
VCPLSVCSIAINHDLPEPQPLLLIPGGSKERHGFYFPEGANGTVTHSTGETTRLSCPGNINGFNSTNIGPRTALATCVCGTTFSVNLVSYNFSNFACKRFPSYIARYSGSTCYDGTKPQIEIVFEVESGFYKLRDVGFDDVMKTTLYARAIIVSGIADFQKVFPKPSSVQGSFFLGIPVYNLYTQITQIQTICNILGLQPSGNNFINATYFLSKGHLSAKADFVYCSQQRATFHYVNVAPQ